MVVVVAVAVLGLIATASVRRNMVDRLDSELRALRVLPEPDSRNDPAPDDQLSADPDFESLQALVLVFDDNFDFVAARPQGLENSPARPNANPEELFALRTDPNVVIDLDSVDGSDSFRAVLSPNRRRGVTVYALSTSDIDATVTRLRNTFLIGGIVVIVSIAGAVWLITKRAFSPVDEMIESAGLIGDGNLDVRVRTTSSIAEVGRLGSALNSMLVELETASSDREEANQALRRFVADASHELRTPVATVLGYVELYQSGAADGPGETERAMDRIANAGVRMERLVEDLLTLTKLDEGANRTHLEFDIDELIRDLVVDAAVTHQGHDYTFDPAAEPARVFGDADLLTMAITNVLRNAAIHTPAGTAVSTTSATVDGAVRIEIADNGPGMPPVELERIFDRFHRSDEGRANRGSGLGLAIVAAVLDAHGGTVSARSTLGDGSTFTIELPAT